MNIIDMGITLHDNNGVESIDMCITIKDVINIDNDGLDSFDMDQIMSNSQCAKLSYWSLIMSKIQYSMC